MRAALSAAYDSNRSFSPDVYNSLMTWTPALITPSIVKELVTPDQRWPSDPAAADAAIDGEPSITRDIDGMPVAAVMVAAVTNAPCFVCVLVSNRCIV